MLVAASLNVAACASRQARQVETTQDSSVSEMNDRTVQAQNAANDSLRK